MNEKMLTRYTNNKRAQSLTEYGLLLALVSIGVIIVLAVLGPRMSGFFQTVDSTLESVVPAPSLP